jgi:hypothetical protein
VAETDRQLVATDVSAREKHRPRHAGFQHGFGKGPGRPLFAHGPLGRPTHRAERLAQRLASARTD